MLPGLDGTGKLFKQFATGLPSSLVPIICNYPSDASLGYVDLKKVADKLIPKDEPFFILGESFSGPIAIQLALRQSKQLKGLILVNTFLSCPRPILARGLPLMPNWLLERPPNLVFNFIVKSSEIESTARQEVSAIVKALDVTVVRSRLESIQAIDVSREACLVKVPVCIIQSLNDNFIPKEATRRLVAAFENSVEIEMPGNHFVLQTYPRQSAVEVAKFCSQ